MTAWSRFPFVRLTIAWILGIVWAYYGPVNSLYITIGLSIVCLVYTFLVFCLPRTFYYQASAYIGALGLMGIALLGYWNLWLHQDFHDPKHIKQKKAPISAYTAVIQSPIQEKEQGFSLVVCLKQARIDGHWQSVKGKVKLYIRKPWSQQLEQSQVLLVLGQPQVIAQPGNPHEFDQATYLSHQNIYHQHFIQAKQIKIIKNQDKHRWQHILSQLRNYSQARLMKHIKGKQEQGILSALVLGDKASLDDALKTAYGASGTMHVLAVSGLHVGILYALLRMLLQWLSKWHWSRWTQGLLVISLLWLYASITGLTPSVLRATLMFSLMILAKLFSRSTNSYNLLSTSAFIVLLLDPFLLWSVGFQLSYLAVLGIIYLQPKIACWLHVKNRLLNYLWLASSVSLAAQCATTPLSIYYFHQFPVYFLIANWIIVPAAFLIVSLSIAVLLTSSWFWLSSWIVMALAYSTRAMNKFVVWMSHWPGSVLEDISWTKTQLFLAYALLIGLLLFFQRRKFRYIVFSFLLGLGWSIEGIQRVLQQQKQQGFILHKIKGHTVLALFKGRYSWLIIDELWPEYTKAYTYHIKPSQLANGINQCITYPYQDADQQVDFPWCIWKGLKIGIWQQKVIMIIDRASVCHFAGLSGIKTDWLVIEQNAVKDLRVLLDRFQFDHLMIGNTNHPKVVAKLQQQADQFGIQAHVVAQQGAVSCF